ncbi:hypothetical protein [Lacimicrobium sp. SS2-24]|uniref:hypothetical protein n=1 Tax=Lacimicrobium sp. SS2-24 TaxID=2005569 RepID=UPI000B4B01DB|nr:hypothetical protein [Lacimicrobium sp. SS2-24]
MRLLCCAVCILLFGCASQEQLAEYEQGMRDDVHCPGEAEQSYRATLYSSEDKEKMGKIQVSTHCQPVETSTEFERENRRQ